MSNPKKKVAMRPVKLMKYLRKIPQRFLQRLWSRFPRAAARNQAKLWAASHFSLPAPWSVKMAVLDRYKIPGAAFVESGTFHGDTTRFLSQKSPKVVSLEPMEHLYLGSKKRLSDLSNVMLINKSSEEGFQEAIRHAETDDLCFWLDGHFSKGDTFCGEQDTPIIFELETIADGYRTGRIRNTVVFVDDVRLFAQQYKQLPENPAREGYPPLFWVASWAENLGLNWFIEHDIFVAKSSR